MTLRNGRKVWVDPDRVGVTTPLRLAVAATIAYPDGSMTASGLRREAAKGRLVIERTAGKDYTSLEEILRMRELCRVEAKVRDSTCVVRAPESGAKPCGSSVMATAISPRDALAVRLKGRRQSPNRR